MSIVKFDKKTAEIVQKEIEQAAQEIARRHGITIRSAGGRISSIIDLTLKFECKISDKKITEEKKLILIFIVGNSSSNQKTTKLFLCTTQTNSSSLDLKSNDRSSHFVHAD